MKLRIAPPNPERNYTWECAIDRDCREGLLAQGFELPERSGSEYQLPEVEDVTTVFAWSSMACITGTCGARISLGLIWPYRVVKENEGANDGIVAVKSGQFGIVMGTQTNDHVHWGTPEKEDQGAIIGFFSSWFGEEEEPAYRFYDYWFAKLSRAGY